MARDNTVKYQWRVLQLLPGEERPSYAGLQVDVLERSDGDLMLRYHGEVVDFQEGPPPSSALWGAATGCSSDLELQEVADGVVSSYLNEAQRERLAALESSDQDEVNVEGKAAKCRGGKAKPVRHQLHRTPTPTQQAPLGGGTSGQGARVGPSGPLPGSWVIPSGNTSKQGAHPPRNSAPTSEPRPRLWLQSLIVAG